jgi:sialate O-acetylesterase
MLSLPSIYQDGIVLQRDQTIPLRGRAGPNAEVAITLAGYTSILRSDASGHWKTSLAALPAGGPHELKIESENETRRISDVLVGDVWICSGQSNMWWPLSLCEGGGKPARALPILRFLNVDELPALEPAADWVRPPHWQHCTAENAGRMSGVGYHFAHRLLQADPDVPIGIILVAVGGTRIETWMSAEALVSVGAQENKPNAEEKREFPKRLGIYLDGLSRQDIETIPAKIRAFAELETDCAHWPVMELPGYWQDAGLKFNGVVWFRREIELSSSWLVQPLQLSLGACDKSERTYFNGHEIGRTDIHRDPAAWARPRHYSIPADLIRPGKNVISVRVFSHAFGGGMTGPAKAMNLTSQDGQTLPLQGPWHYQVESNFGNATSLHGNRPSRLWNGMVAPLTTFPARGMVWYQGESNADDTALYARLFPAMIRDWRAQWGMGQMPFLFVQLPGYGPGTTWPELRAAQAAALELPATAMAVAIDQGDAEDVHPTKKREVGTRLALLALKHTYGHANIACEGPVVSEALRTAPDKITISFTNAQGLHSNGGDAVGGFEASGQDGVFAPLPAATIEGERILLLDVPNDASSIRFGWQPYPTSHICNRHGLPAAPFCVAIKEA